MSTNLARNEIMPTFARLTPIIVKIILCIYIFINQTIYSLYLFVCFIIIFASNFCLKIIFKSFLGSIGSRPSGASGCGLKLDNNKSLSYGMPSGHSQIAWAFVTYLILKLLIDDVLNDNTDNTSNNHNIITNNKYTIIKSFISAGVLLIIAMYISYSRVMIEGCHTWMQVIIGGSIGAAMATAVFILEKYIL